MIQSGLDLDIRGCGVGSGPLLGCAVNWARGGEVKV